MKERRKTFPGASGILALAALAALAPATDALAAAGDERPEAQFERSSAELAATLSLSKLEAAIAAAEPDGTALFTEMTGDPARYRSAEDSRESLREVYAAGIAARYSEEARRMLDKLAGDKGFDAVFTDSFAQTAISAPKALVEGAVASGYAKAFKVARDRACSVQRERIVSKIRPSEDEVDSLGRDALVQLLVERISQAQDTAVFEENLKYIETSIAKPLVEDAWNQRSFQAGVAQTAAVDGYAPSVIASNLVARVEEAIAAKRKEAAEPGSVYGLFPSIRAKSAPEAAAKRLGVVLDRALDEMPVPLDEDAIALAIAKDIASHRRFGDSRKVFEPGLGEAMAAAALKRVSDAAPAAERGEVESFAAGHFREKKTAEAISARVSRELDANLKRLRDAFAANQVETSFPTLCDGSWLPGEELVDSVAASNDFRKALAGWRAVAGLEGFRDAEKAGLFLEEASALLDARIVEAFVPGVAAMSSQHRTVEEIFPRIKAWQQKEKSDLAGLSRHYADEVAKAWGDSRAKVLPQAVAEGGAYQGLFPSTVRMVEVYSHAVMDALEEEKEKPVEEEPEPVEETPPPPPEELEEIEMAFRIVYSRHSDDIVAQIFLNDAESSRFTCPYPPNGYRRNAAAFAERTTAAIGGLLAETAKTNRIALTVVLDIQDPLVYYGAVSDASWLLKGIVEELGDYVTSFEMTEKR